MLRRFHQTATAKLVARRGVITLEFILVFPILLILLLASIQFGQMILVEQAVSHAATVGAREAGKWATMAEVVDSVNQVLATRGIEIGQEASVVVEDPELIPAVRQAGEPACIPPSPPDLVPGDIRVSVCVDAASQPLCNLLRCFGFDMTGRHFECSSFVRKE